jgi:hypothetical protein
MFVKEVNVEDRSQPETRQEDEDLKPEEVRKPEARNRETEGKSPL